MALRDTIETSIALASLRQICAAIDCFNNGEFECAITLAAAGEGILPAPAKENTYIFGVLRNHDDLEVNLVINWLKHGKDFKTATISQFEAAITIARSISKFIAVHNGSHPKFEEFMEWGRTVGHFPWYPEIVPIVNGADGSIILYDIYVVASGKKTWIGSRRSYAQCVDAFNAYQYMRERQRVP